MEASLPRVAEEQFLTTHAEHVAQAVLFIAEGTESQEREMISVGGPVRNWQRRQVSR